MRETDAGKGSGWHLASVSGPTGRAWLEGSGKWVPRVWGPEQGPQLPGLRTIILRGVRGIKLGNLKGLDEG